MSRQGVGSSDEALATKGSTSPRTRHRRRRAAVALATVAAVASAVQGCGTDDAGPATASPGAKAATSGAVATATARLRVLQKGLATAPPTSGPTAQAAKKVWIISCGDVTSACSVSVDANIEAGKALGWDMVRYDAKLDPTRVSTGIREAIADKADAVLEVGFDCPAIKGALQEAKKAGVVTYGAGGTDCDDPTLGDGSAPLFTLTDIVPPGLGPAWVTFAKAWGADKAQYAIAKTKGAAKVINLEAADIPGTRVISEGFAKSLARCGGCSVVQTVKFAGADVTTNNIAQRLTNALAAHPEADVIHLPLDALLPLVSAAVIESGRSSDLLVIGGEGFAANLDDIRKGGVQDAALAFDSRWQSWAEIDDLNRRFAGQKPVYGGWAYSVVDKDTNLPAKGEFVSKADFRTAYRTIWGR